MPGQSERTWDLLRTVLDEGFQSIDRRLHELGPLQPDRFSLKEANARLRELAQVLEVAAMKVRVEVVCLNAGGDEQRRQVLTIERRELAMEPMRLPDRGPKTFRPMKTWLNGQTSPEMLYLETKWASLIPFARAADLLKEVLPVGNLVNAESVRNHLQLTAERIEWELGEERQLNRFEGSEQEWERQPLPDGPITVGIDGG
jgi:hypothetical protein